MVRPVKTIVQCYALLVPTHAGIDRRRMNASFLQVLHLVFHECNERCDHQTQSLPRILVCHDKSRNLKTDTLATSCGHKSQGVAAGKYGLNDLRLKRAEIIVSEISM